MATFSLTYRATRSVRTDGRAELRGTLTSSAAVGLGSTALTLVGSAP